MDSEKRDAERIKKTLVVLFSQDNEKWDISHIKDISLKGIQVTVSTYLETGKNLTLLVKIPFMPFRRLKIKGAVVDSSQLLTPFGEHVAGSYIAHIEFLDLNKEAADLIREYVKWFLSRKGG